jgi:uncharacterized membrane protein (DUF4010 family)
MEREWSNKDLGIRTFALISLLGMIGSLFSESMALASFVGVFLIVIFANARSLLVNRSLETTTSAALLVIFVLGALVGHGHLFTPVAAAILMTMLLAWKVELHRFAGGLQTAEIRSAVLLGLLGLVVYPILPDRFIDRWNLLNPREAWITVIVIAGIGFVNYVLLKIYGAKGLYLSGFLGGFVNSSAAAIELTKPLSGTSSDAAIAALLLTIVAMFARNLLILALFAPRAIVTAAAPLVTMALAASIFVRSAKAKVGNEPVEIHLESPVSVKRVAVFAALFLVIQIVSTLGQRYFGKLGFLAVSALGGLVSSASTSAAAATLVTHNELSAALGGAGAVLASVASALINLPIIYRSTKNPALSKRLALLTLALCAIGVGVLISQRYISFLWK